VDGGGLSGRVRWRRRLFPLGVRARAHDADANRHHHDDNPVFASAVGALTLGEPIGINLVVGLLAVFAGIWIATSKSTGKKRDTLAA
jgi:hypothetical protein